MVEKEMGAHRAVVCVSHNYINTTCSVQVVFLSRDLRADILVLDNLLGVHLWEGLPLPLSIPVVHCLGVGIFDILNNG